MIEEQKTWTFRAEEIFEDIPNDPKNVMMKIPEEIMELQGWKEGDTVKVSWGDQGTVIIEKADKQKE
tara:strand:+ start:484 stop:684 length:201 start_codon:yes stop_codon:yes gene_type:complete